jgi:phosphotransferase family enzyme
VTAEKTGEAAPIAAAQAVARAHGVACDEAVRIAAGSNVLVHLKPAPVVARVMTGTALLHDDVERWLSREVAVGAFLARTGLVVAPSDILPPGPHEQDGLWMTLWRFVPHHARAAPPEPRELGRSLRALHAALAEFPGELPPLSGIRGWLAGLLGELRPSPVLTRRDIDWLGFQMESLTPAVFESALPAQALHGDASLSNVLRPDGGGLVWNDLEDVCAGPVAWDVAGLVTSARGRGQSAKFIEELVASYGEPGVDSLETFLDAHALYDVIWQAFEARRRPQAMQRAAATLARWRERRPG